MSSLVVKHVAWEGPHRIGAALCEAGEVTVVNGLAGEPLPDPASVDRAIFMGGPMNVDETERYPGLAAEREWIEAALDEDIPLLGVCLGAQLIARALGAEVRPGPAKEIGWAPVTIHAPDDPLVGHLAPVATVLHWHGDILDLPPGAEQLASSEQTEIQAFSHGRAWGLLFHAEADAELIENWLAEPVMADEAAEALGPGAPEELRAGAAAHGDALTAASTPAFATFAAL